MGAKNNFLGPILLLGKDQYDRIKYLRLDNADLALEPDALNKIYTKKFGEPGFIYAYDNITTKLLGEQRVDLLKKNLQWIKENRYLLVQIMADLGQPINFFHDCDIDSNLYIKGFWTDFEKKEIEQAHAFIKKVVENDFDYNLPKFPTFHSTDIESGFYRILIRNFLGFAEIYLFHEKTILLDAFYSKKIFQKDYLGSQKRKPQEVIELINLLYKSKRKKEDRVLLQQLKCVLLDNFEKFHPINSELPG